MELEFRTTDAISSNGENSIVVIWHGTATKTGAWSFCDGMHWTGVASAFGTNCSPSSLGENASGELYICDITNGNVYKIIPAR